MTIVNNTVNDIAATVLPDAPIDPATGLPVPTIAVATAEGYSQIGWDGVSTDNVWDATSLAGASTRWDNVSFTSSNQVVANLGFVGNSGFGSVVVFNVLTADVSYAGNTLDDTANQTFDIFEVYNGAAQPVQIEASPSSNTLRNAKISAVKDSLAIETTLRDAVALVARDPDAPATGMHALLTSTYNTGYMPANIKGAFLSDTDDTDLVGSGELVTNGTFDTDTTGWTSIDTSTFSVSGGQVTLTNNGTVHGKAYQAITTVVGQRYVITADLISISLGRGRVAVQNGLPSSGFVGGLIDSSSPGSFAVDFVASATTTYLVFGNRNDTDATSVWDNISLKLADADRSVNNKGLIVNGTVTRTPVATGADLVAYSGFSASNYFSQPYNSALDFGTGDFSVMGWVKVSANATRTIFSRSDTGESGARILFRNTGSGFDFFANTSLANAAATSSALPVNAWTFFVARKSNSVLSIWVNGVLASTTPTVSVDLNNTSAVSMVGQRVGTSNPFDLGSLALLRISATAPTAEQIAKIYNDEKFLFQDNAQATLYGASDAVTALAHDPVTDLLHVGTSAGRSVFSGLRRVSNTTTAVGTAISAQAGLVVEE